MAVYFTENRISWVYVQSLEDTHLAEEVGVSNPARTMGPNGDWILIDSISLFLERNFRLCPAHCVLWKNSLNALPSHCAAPRSNSRLRDLSSGRWLLLR